MSEPRIYTKNYVNADDTLTLSHASASKGYLYDWDMDSKWTSSGADDDATQISIEVVFNEGSVAVNRTIDAMFLINHNLKTWNFDYWNGSAWVTLASETTDAASNAIKTFGSVTTSKVRLLATATQVADAEKYLGEFIVCALRLDIGKEIDKYEVRYREKIKDLTLGDGSIHQMVTRFSQNRISKYQARATFKYVSASLLDSLKAIKENGIPFIWYPETTNRPREIYYVHWSNEFAPNFVGGVKVAGYELVLELKEV